jgi:hypothetical protein
MTTVIDTDEEAERIGLLKSAVAVYEDNRGRIIVFNKPDPEERKQLRWMLTHVVHEDDIPEPTTDSNGQTTWATLASRNVPPSHPSDFPPPPSPQQGLAGLSSLSYTGLSVARPGDSAGPSPPGQPTISPPDSFDWVDKVGGFLLCLFLTEDLKAGEKKKRAYNAKFKNSDIYIHVMTPQEFLAGEEDGTIVPWGNPGIVQYNMVYCDVDSLVANDVSFDLRERKIATGYESLSEDYDNMRIFSIMKKFALWALNRGIVRT